jgi:hypothetical protein
MSKKEFQRALIAAALGALVTFLTKFLESMSSVDAKALPSVAGGVVATVAYLKLTAKLYI